MNSNGLTDHYTVGAASPPVTQNFHGPSSTFINIFQQPGEYRITTTFSSNGGRTIPVVTNPHQSQQRSPGVGMEMARPLFGKENTLVHNSVPNPTTPPRF